MSSGCISCICSTNLAIPSREFSTCVSCLSPSTATSNLAFETSIPTYASLLVAICSSSSYNRGVPALVLGLEDPSTVRALVKRTWRSCCTTVLLDLPDIDLPCPSLWYYPTPEKHRGHDGGRFACA